MKVRSAVVLVVLSSVALGLNENLKSAAFRFTEPVYPSFSMEDDVTATTPGIVKRNGEPLDPSCRPVAVEFKDDEGQWRQVIEFTKETSFDAVIPLLRLEAQEMLATDILMSQVLPSTDYGGFQYGTPSFYYDALFPQTAAWEEALLGLYPTTIPVVMQATPALFDEAITGQVSNPQFRYTNEFKLGRWVWNGPLGMAMYGGTWPTSRSEFEGFFAPWGYSQIRRDENSYVQLSKGFAEEQQEMRLKIACGNGAEGFAYFTSNGNSFSCGDDAASDLC